MKNANLGLRIKALLIDYLYIIVYLAELFGLAMAVYFWFFKGIPEFTQIQSQWIAFLTTVLPITVFFTIMEAGKASATFGKKKVKLKVIYLNNPIMGSLIRNIFKFLPWQLGHMAVISGIYNGFESWYVIILYGLAILLPIVYIAMIAFRKDHRHIPDLLAASFVTLNEKNLM
mgnify:CR=1 FL=1